MLDLHRQFWSVVVIDELADSADTVSYFEWTQVSRSVVFQRSGEPPSELLMTPEVELL